MFLKNLIYFLSKGIALFVIKMLSSLVIGTACAIIVQVLIDSSTLSFIFVLLSVTLAFLRLIWNYRLMGVIVINLFFVTLFLLFKLYVGVALLK